MNKENLLNAFVVLSSENLKLQGENIKLKTANLHLENQIDQLTNNWNELEEWLKSYIALIDNPDTFEEQTLEDLKEILDKMKEIKGEDNGNKEY